MLITRPFRWWWKVLYVVIFMQLNVVSVTKEGSYTVFLCERCCSGVVSCYLTPLDARTEGPWTPSPLRLSECPIFFLTLSFTQVLSSNCFTVQIHICCSYGLYCPSCAICYQLWLWTFKDDLFLGSINEQCSLVIRSHFLSVWV